MKWPEFVLTDQEEHQPISGLDPRCPESVNRVAHLLIEKHTFVVKRYQINIKDLFDSVGHWVRWKAADRPGSNNVESSRYVMFKYAIITSVGTGPSVSNPPQV